MKILQKRESTRYSDKWIRYLSVNTQMSIETCNLLDVYDFYNASANPISVSRECHKCMIFLALVMVFNRLSKTSNC